MVIINRQQMIRQQMIKEISEEKLDRKKLRLLLVGLSMIPYWRLQFELKKVLAQLDVIDYKEGRISKPTFVIKNTLRFIPIGGLAIAALDVGTELVSESIDILTVEGLNKLSDEELKILYNQINSL